MGDGLALGHLGQRPLRVYVYPLVIGSRLGKLVDAMLVDDRPFGQSDFLAFERLGLF